MVETRPRVAGRCRVWCGEERQASHRDPRAVIFGAAQREGSDAESAEEAQGLPVRIRAGGAAAAVPDPMHGLPAQHRCRPGSGEAPCATPSW